MCKTDAYMLAARFEAGNRCTPQTRTELCNVTCVLLFDCVICLYTIGIIIAAHWAVRVVAKALFLATEGRDRLINTFFGETV